MSKIFWLKILVDFRAGFGGWADGWIDGWVGVKLVLRDCLVQSKNVLQNSKPIYTENKLQMVG